MILFPLFLMLSTLLYSSGIPFLPTEVKNYGDVRQKDISGTNEETPLLEHMDEEIRHALILDNLHYAGKVSRSKQDTSQDENSKQQLNTSRLYFTHNSGLEVNNSKYGVHLRRIGFRDDEGKSQRAESLDPIIKEEHFPSHSDRDFQYLKNEAHRERKSKGKEDLIIKVGSQEIRIRPDYYGNGFPHEPNYKEKAVQFQDPVTESGHRLANQHRKSDSNASAIKHRKSYPSVSDFEHGEFYHRDPANEDGNSFSLESVDERNDFLFSHSIITEQIDSLGLFDYEFTETVHPGTNDHSEFEQSRKEVSVQIHENDTDTNSDCQPPECVEIVSVHRGVIKNGYLIQKNQKGDTDILERRLSQSVSGEESEAPDISEDQIRPTYEYPPLIIEEIDLSHVKHLIPPEFFNTTGEIFPRGNPENRVTEKQPELQSTKIAEHTSDPLNFSEETELQPFEEPKPTSGKFEIPSSSKEQVLSFETSDSTSSDISNGSGDEETVFLKNDPTALKAVGTVTNNLTDRRLSIDLDQDLSEGSGVESGKTAPVKKVSPRIINIFATSNDSSTPCTTPKGEAGHCKDVRHCLLHEVLNNFNVYLQYVCLIRSVFIGVCCPDNPVISQPIEPDDSNNKTESTESLTEFSQPAKGCGVNFKTRIVGGTIAKPHEWTWMVALMKKNRFFCGGVLINNWYVLTAAHCTLGVKTRELKIRFGEYNFLDARDHKEDIGVKEIKRHAQFITLTFQHDIALLKLKRSVEFSQFVGTICLPREDKLYNDVNATVVGWGTVSFGGSVSPVLREVILPVWNNADCDRTYLFEDINDSFLCAGSPEPDQDACQGDSGGPLMAVNDEGLWEAIGIVSWGRRCGDPKYPGVYTRITTYLDWIEKNIT